MSRFARITALLGVLAGVALGALPSASATASHASGPSPSCATGGLVIWISQSSGTAGSVVYTLEFTNQSGHTCTLRGYPGVSAVNLHGHQLGSPARRQHAAVRTVTLPNNASASTSLQITEAGNFPGSRCHMRDAAGVRVYPPNQRSAKIVPLPFDACSDPATVFMSVRPLSGS